MPYDLFGSYRVTPLQASFGMLTGEEEEDDLFGGYRVTEFAPPLPIADTSITHSPAEPEMGLPGGLTGTIGSGIAQGLYGIGSAWNAWTGDPDEALQYSQLAGNIDTLAAERGDGFVSTVVRGVARSLTMAAPAIGAGAIAAVTAPVSVPAGLASIGAASLAGLATNVPATYYDALNEADQLDIKGDNRETYARNSALIEGTITGLFSAAGAINPALAGMEAVMGEAVKGVGKTVGKELIKRGVSELAEEELITVGQTVNRYLYTADPSQITVSQLGYDMAQTAAQTLLTMGVLEGGVAGTRAYLSRGQTDPTGAFAAEPDRTGPEPDVGLIPAPESVKSLQVAPEEPATGYTIADIQTALGIDEEQARAVDEVARAAGLDRSRIRFERGDETSPTVMGGVQEGRKPQRYTDKAKASVEYAEGGMSIIRGFQKADVSSGLHELLHVARKQVLNRDIDPEARLGIGDEDIDVLEGWAGVRNGKWGRKEEEKFARAGEKYLLEGKAPTPRLQPIFEKIGQWMKQIYVKLKGSKIDIGISPEMRGVFDKLFSRGELLEIEPAKTQPEAIALPPKGELASKTTAQIGDLQLRRERLVRQLDRFHAGEIGAAMSPKEREDAMSYVSNKIAAIDLQLGDLPAKGELASETTARALLDTQPEAVKSYLSKPNPSRADLAELLVVQENDANFVQRKYTAAERKDLGSVLQKLLTGDTEEQTKEERRREEREKAVYRVAESAGMESTDPRLKDVLNFDLSNRQSAPAPESLKALGIETLYGLETPEAQTLAETLTGEKLQLANMGDETRAQFVQKVRNGGAIASIVKMDRKTLKDRLQYAQSLLHEVGHAIVYSKNKLNMFADETKKAFGFVGEVVTEERQAELYAQVRAAAEAQLGPEAAPLELDRLANTKFARAFKRENTVDVKLDHISRQELLGLSRPWRPYDPDVATAEWLGDYRYTNHELLADGLSMLLNSPGLLKQHAPTFWGKIHTELQNKPQFLEAYYKAQELAQGGTEARAEAMAQQNLKAFGPRTDEAIIAAEQRKIAQRRDGLKGRFTEALLSNMIDRAAPAKAAIGALTPETLSLHAEADKLAYQGRNQDHIEGDRWNENIQPVLEAGVDETHMAEIFWLRRIANEDTEADIPEVFSQSYTAETARTRLKQIHKQLGDETYQKAVVAHEGIGEQLMDVLKELRKIDGAISDEAWDTITRNNGTYIHGASLKWFNENGAINGGLQMRTGELDDKLNPLHGTLLKLLALRRRLDRVKNARDVVLALQRGGQIEQIHGGDWKSKPMNPPKQPGYAWVHASVKVEGEEQGKMRWVAVPKTVAEMFESQDDTAIALARAGNEKLYGWLAPWYVGRNLSFWVRQFFADPYRTLKTLPAATKRLTGTAVKRREIAKTMIPGTENFKLAFLTSAYHVWGKGGKFDALAKKVFSTANITEAQRLTKVMIKHGFIDARYLDGMAKMLATGGTEADTLEGAVANTHQLLLEKVGVRNANAVKPATPENFGRIKKLFAAMDDLTQFQATYARMQGAIPTIRLMGETQEAGFVVRKWTGTPDMNQRGRLADVINFVNMFGKIGLTGMQADAWLAGNKISAQTYAAGFAYTHGPAKALKWAVLSGLATGIVREVLGDDWAEDVEKYRQAWLKIPKYFRDAYDAIPLWTFIDTDGRTKPAFVLVAKDPLGVALGEMMDATFAAMQEDDPKGFADNLGSMVRTMLQHMPLSSSFSPPFQWASVWTTFAAHEIPSDPHFGGPIYTQTSVEGSKWGALKAVTRWQLNQFGVLSSLTGWATDALLAPSNEYDRQTYSEKTLRAIPGVNRLIRVSDRGDLERDYQAIEELNKQNATIRGSFDGLTQHLVSMQWRLEKVADTRALSPEEALQLTKLKAWDAQAYGPLREQMKEAVEAGDTAEIAKIREAAKLQSQLLQESDSLPDYVMPRVLYQMTGPAPEEKAQERMRTGKLPVEERAETAEQRRNLATLVLAKRMPFTAALQYLRNGFIEQMDKDQLVTIARSQGMSFPVGTVLTKEKQQETLRFVIQSGYQPPQYQGNGPTAFGERVQRLQEVLRQASR